MSRQPLTTLYKFSCILLPHIRSISHQRGSNSVDSKMFSKASLTVFSVIVLCLVLTEALSRMTPRKRCRCINLIDRLQPSMKINNIKIFFKQPYCENNEIIVNLQTGERVCLNPNAARGRKLIASMKSKMNA
ncbi:interleukin-8-like [Rhinoraja longicauda]